MKPQSRKALNHILNTSVVLLAIIAIVGALTAYAPEMLKLIGCFAIGYWMADLIPVLNKITDRYIDADQTPRSERGGDKGEV